MKTIVQFKNNLTILQIIKSAAKFYNLSLAISSLDRYIQRGKWSIVLGDNNQFWIVTNREASILNAAGYEIYL